MNADDLMVRLLKSYADQTPMFVLCFAAIVVAAARYRRAPRAMGLLFAAGVCLTALALVMPPVFLYATTPKVLGGAGGNAMLLHGLRFVITLLHAVGVALLITAAFADRPAATRDGQ